MAGESAESGESMSGEKGTGFAPGARIRLRYGGGATGTIVRRPVRGQFDWRVRMDDDKWDRLLSAYEENLELIEPVQQKES